MVSLNISNNRFNQKEIDQLNEILRKSKLLQFLDVSFNLPSSGKQAKFSGELMEIKTLSFLNASGNLDLDSFFFWLSQHKEPMELKELNISNNGEYFNWSLFAKSFPLFSRLKKLNIGNMKIKFERVDTEFLSPVKKSTVTNFQNALSGSTRQQNDSFPSLSLLKSLEEIIFSVNNNLSLLNSLVAKIKNENLSISIDTEGEWAVSESIFFVFCNKKVNLEGINMKNCSSDDPQVLKYLNNFAATDLSIPLEKFSHPIDPNSLASKNLLKFFGAFHRVTVLRIELMNAVDFTFLELLLERNPITEIEIVIYDSFNQFDELLEIIQILLPKRVSITYLSEIPSVEIGRFMRELAESSLWNQVEIFEWHSAILKYGLLILKKGNFLNLRSVIFTVKWESEVLDNNFTLPSVREVDLIVQQEWKGIQFESYLLTMTKIFPRVASLKVTYCEQQFPLFDFSCLTNLHSFQIECLRVEGEKKNFIEQLRSLSYLTHFALQETQGFNWGENRKGLEILQLLERVTVGKHMKFPALIFSQIKTIDCMVKREFVEKAEESLLKRGIALIKGRVGQNN